MSGDNGSNPSPPADAPATGRSLVEQAVGARLGVRGAVERIRGPMLRLTRPQRELLRQGLADIRALRTPDETWQAAAEEAEQAQEQLAIPDLAAGYVMWTTNLASLAEGHWWLLMPGCGAPNLQASICRNLARPWLARRPEYATLAAALDEGRYPSMKEVLEWTERVRCVLWMHVR